MRNLIEMFLVLGEGYWLFTAVRKELIETILKCCLWVQETALETPQLRRTSVLG